MMDNSLKRYHAVKLKIALCMLFSIQVSGPVIEVMKLDTIGVESSYEAYLDETPLQDRLTDSAGERERTTLQILESASKMSKEEYIEHYRKYGDGGRRAWPVTVFIFAMLFNIILKIISKKFGIFSLPSSEEKKAE